MTEKVFPYHAEAQLNDGTAELLDLEERGWADPERLAKVVKWSFIPKADATPPWGGGKWPVVIVAIPSGAKPVFKARAFGSFGTGNSEGGVKFRCYAIGYKLGSEEYLTWVLPTGDIEVGEPAMADQILSAINKGVPHG